MGDNPSFITVNNLFGVYHIILMKYDERTDEYKITASKQVRTKTDAYTVALEWAKSEGVEIR